MVFHSLAFLVFFPAVILLYYLFPHKVRKIFLLAAGYFFYYCFKPEYLILLIAATTVDYFLALAIGKRQTNDGGKKAGGAGKGKALFVLGLIGNILLLFLFKYLTLFSDTVNLIIKPLDLNTTLPQFKWLLPVGISYYTFKKISYLIDVYRRTIPAEKNWLNFSLYVSFFPEIMAGPIDRAGKLMPQFSRQIKFDYHNAADGLKRMAWGFFKKLVIADRLALYVDKVYAQPDQYDGLSLIMATVYFSFQIYCDFSGYSDIAIGAGKVMGFELAENFDRPYFSKSIGDFWKRWHISLSSWLMDYLFLPIAYRVSDRIKTPRLLKLKAETWAYIIGINITMLLCGVWHGSGWTFIIWGGVHGLLMALSFATRKLRRKMTKAVVFKGRRWRSSYLHQGVQVVLTFGAVTLAWIFFRADSIQDALYIITHLFNDWPSLLRPSGLINSICFGLLKKELIIAAVSIAAMLTVEVLRRKKSFTQFIAGQNVVLRWSFYIVLLLWIIAFAQTGAADFIYFRF